MDLQLLLLIREREIQSQRKDANGIASLTRCILSSTRPRSTRLSWEDGDCLLASSLILASLQSDVANWTSILSSSLVLLSTFLQV